MQEKKKKSTGGSQQREATHGSPREVYGKPWAGLMEVMEGSLGVGSAGSRGCPPGRCPSARSGQGCVQLREELYQTSSLRSQRR